MSRAPSAFVSLLMQPGVKVFELVYLGFSSGPAYLCGLPFSVPYGGNTYSPALSFLSMSEISESGRESAGIQVQISGVPSTNIGTFLSEKVRGRPITVSLAAIDPATFQLAVDPNTWVGKMDTAKISDAAGTDGTSIITIACEHIGMTGKRPSVVRYTTQTQQALYAGDLGLQYTAELENKNIVWPDKAFFQ